RQRCWSPGRPTAGVVFYRAHWITGNLAPVAALVRALEEHGLNVLAGFGARPGGGPGGGLLPAGVWGGWGGGGPVGVRSSPPPPFTAGQSPRRGEGGKRPPLSPRGRVAGGEGASRPRRAGVAGHLLFQQRKRLGGEHRRAVPARRGHERRPARVRRPHHHHGG